MEFCISCRIIEVYGTKAMVDAISRNNSLRSCQQNDFLSLLYIFEYRYANYKRIVNSFNKNNDKHWNVSRYFRMSEIKMKVSTVDIFQRSTTTKR